MTCKDCGSEFHDTFWYSTCLGCGYIYKVEYSYKESLLLCTQRPKAFCEGIYK